MFEKISSKVLDVTKYVEKKINIQRTQNNLKFGRVFERWEPRDQILSSESEMKYVVSVVNSYAY